MLAVLVLVVVVLLLALVVVALVVVALVLLVLVLLVVVVVLLLLEVQPVAVTWAPLLRGAQFLCCPPAPTSTCRAQWQGKVVQGPVLLKHEEDPAAATEAEEQYQE